MVFASAALVIAGFSATPVGREMFAVAPAPGSPNRAALERMFDRVAVVDHRPHRPGYDRSCARGRHCVFGPAWQSVAGGCDTRNRVLAAQLAAVTRRSDDHCLIASGTLDDPYTGKRIAFTRTHAAAVQIDHVYPLAAAWDLGASSWPPARRQAFANDATYNLLAVDGPANQDKGDATPADWLPPSRAHRCYYAGRYLAVAVRYGLPITRADRAALRSIARRC
jgi:hypothetical protein